MKTQSWYDRHTKSWVVQMIDENGNQIGSAEYCGTKEDRDYCVKEMESKMADKITITDIRAMTGLNKTDFAKRYNIPFRTVQNWELGTRECPEYVLELLERVVREDFEKK